MSTIESGVYFIQNVGSGTVIDLKSGSSVDGTGTQGWIKREFSDVWVPAQLWVVNKESGNTYTIQNTNSRTYLDLRGKERGSPIEGFAPSGADNQKWLITQASGTSYVIQNKATDTYVDLNNGDKANGTQVQGWVGSGPSTTNKHQLWEFVHA